MKKSIGEKIAFLEKRFFQTSSIKQIENYSKLNKIEKIPSKMVFCRKPPQFIINLGGFRACSEIATIPNRLLQFPTFQSSLFFLFLILVQSVNAAQIPAINSYATDNAGILSAGAKVQLEKELRDLEKSTSGVQFVVYIENEYPKDFSLEEYTLKIAESNKIGKKRKDNGILLYVAVKDRKYRWEVGYGAESTLNSALLGRISRDYLVPNFRNGNYENGILQAVDVTKRLLLNSSDADIAALKNPADEKSGKMAIAFAFILIIVFAIVIISFATAIRNAIKSPRDKKHKDTIYHGAAWGLFAGGFGRGGFRGGGSGGFGGFSGGGGGFGGGGGSGGW